MARKSAGGLGCLFEGFLARGVGPTFGLGLYLPGAALRRGLRHMARASTVEAHAFLVPTQTSSSVSTLAGQVTPKYHRKLLVGARSGPLRVQQGLFHAWVKVSGHPKDGVSHSHHTMRFSRGFGCQAARRECL